MDVDSLKYKVLFRFTDSPNEDRMSLIQNMNENMNKLKEMQPQMHGRYSSCRKVEPGMVFATNNEIDYNYLLSLNLEPFEGITLAQH